MKPDLSIIIPCFNSSKTIKEAVDSCFNQGLAEAGYKYEIVMVDDGSTDDTRDILEKIKNNTKEINCEINIFFHEKNLGGGATRNTAVEKAQAEIVFCLDSDDILGDKMLLKMLTFLLDKRNQGLKCDGVGIHKSRKFIGNDINNIEVIHEFGYINQIIPAKSLLQSDGIYCPLYSTFMHTKESFKIMGGYPTDHGFDTQSFAWRFLINGLIAYTCPDAEYLHRLHFTKSYYIREYESGRINHNWYKIFEEFMYIFSYESQIEILTFNLNSSTKLISDLLTERKHIFKENYLDYVKVSSSDEYEKLLESTSDIPFGEVYWLAFKKYSRKQYSEAFDLFEKFVKSGLNCGYSHKYLKDISGILNKKSNLINEKIIKQTFNFRKQGSGVNIFIRIIRKIIRLSKERLKKTNKIRKFYYHFLGIKNNIFGYFLENADYNLNLKKIAQIKNRKEIILDMDWGGLGDILVYTPLVRLLKEKYDVDFYLSENCKKVSRNPDTLKMCFEMNPYFKGYKNSDGFKYRKFSKDRSLVNLILDLDGADLIKDLFRQFDINEKALPEIYYKPQRLLDYENTILIDLNFISGHKQGLVYDMQEINEYINKIASDKYKIEYIDPKKQNLYRYTDMIYSSREFITVLSGGAVLAAAINKKAIVFLPKNTRGETIYNFTFKDSKIKYIS